LKLTDRSWKSGDSLAWSAEDELAGKNVHLRGFPKGHQLKLFRWTLSTKRTDDVVTNDPAQLTGACACKDRSSGREHGCAAPCYQIAFHLFPDMSQAGSWT